MSRRRSTAQTGGGNVDLSADALARAGSVMDVNAPGFSRPRSNSLASVSSAGSFDSDFDDLDSGVLSAVDLGELSAWVQSSAGDVLGAVSAPVDTNIRKQFLEFVGNIVEGLEATSVDDIERDYKSAKMAKLLNSVTGEGDKQKLAQYIVTEHEDGLEADLDPRLDMQEFITGAINAFVGSTDGDIVDKLQEMNVEVSQEQQEKVSSSPDVARSFLGAPENLHLNPSQFSVDDEDLEEGLGGQESKGWRAGQDDPNAVMDAAAQDAKRKVHETSATKAAITLGATIGLAFVPFVGPFLALAVGMSYAYNEMSSVGLNKSSMEFSEMEEQLSKTTEALKLRVEKGGFGAEQPGGGPAASGSASLLAARDAAEGANHDLEEAKAGLNRARNEIGAAAGGLDASAPFAVEQVAVRDSLAIADAVDEVEIDAAKVTTGGISDGTEVANAMMSVEDDIDVGQNDGYLEVDGAGGQAEVATASAGQVGGGTRGVSQQGSISAAEVTGGGGSHAATVEAARRGSANMGNGASTR